MSQISKEPSAVSRPEEGGPLSLNHFGNLCSSINMLTSDKSLMTTIPLCQHIWSQLPLAMKQKSQSTSPHQENRGRCEPMVNGCLPGRNMKVLSVTHTHTDTVSSPDIGHMLSASLGQSHRSHESLAMTLPPKNGFMSMTALTSVTPMSSWISPSNTCPTLCRD